jgi:FtsZ-binding cell division protein ZapB
MENERMKEQLASLQQMYNNAQQHNLELEKIKQQLEDELQKFRRYDHVSLICWRFVKFNITEL